MDSQIKTTEISLERWAAWVRLNGSIGLGIQPLAMFDDGERARETFPPMLDDEALAFEQSLVTLKQIDKELYDVLRFRYIRRMSYRAVAMATNQPVKMVHEKTRVAIAFLAGFWTGFMRELPF